MLRLGCKLPTDWSKKYRCIEEFVYSTEYEQFVTAAATLDDHQSHQGMRFHLLNCQ